MVSFKTEFNSVSFGEDEFIAIDGVIDIPEKLVNHFSAFIEADQLVKIEKHKKKDEKKDDKKDEKK